jgi:hypothetical protein
MSLMSRISGLFSSSKSSSNYRGVSLPIAFSPYLLNSCHADSSHRPLDPVAEQRTALACRECWTNEDVGLPQDKTPSPLSLFYPEEEMCKEWFWLNLVKTLLSEVKTEQFVLKDPFTFPR